jgi:hypothetical protein
VDAAATGGSVACGPSGLVLTVSPFQFAPSAANLTVTGKPGYTAASNPGALLGETCSSRFGAATWGTSGGATTFNLAAGSDGACTTGTEGSCQGLVTPLAPKGRLAVAARHTCTIRAADGAVLCSGENNVRAGGGAAAASAGGLPAATPRAWLAARAGCASGPPLSPRPPLPNPQRSNSGASSEQASR